MTNSSIEEILKDLEERQRELKDRIHRLEEDLKIQLDPDFEEQAGQLSSQLVQRRLLEIERNNLRLIEARIARLGNQRPDA